MIVLLDPAGAGEGRVATLAEAEEHHLRVRRAREGEQVELRDGAGLIGAGRLVSRNGRWGIEVQERRVVPRDSGITLAVGAGDRERFEWLVEKATELGVAAVVPVETEFTAAVAGRVRPQHVPRLRRRALEAVKQCGAAWAPEITEPVPLAVLLGRPRPGECWLADAAGGIPDAAAPPALVLVGPEGGLTATERDAAVSAGYRPVRLGPHTLRFETAALVAAAAAVLKQVTPGGVDG